MCRYSCQVLGYGDTFQVTCNLVRFHFVLHTGYFQLSPFISEPHPFTHRIALHPFTHRAGKDLFLIEITLNTGSWKDKPDQKEECKHRFTELLFHLVFLVRLFSCFCQVNRQMKLFTDSRLAASAAAAALDNSPSVAQIPNLPLCWDLRKIHPASSEFETWWRDWW